MWGGVADDLEMNEENAAKPRHRATRLTPTSTRTGGHELGHMNTDSFSVTCDVSESGEPAQAH